jgi:hypothetical protein
MAAGVLRYFRDAGRLFLWYVKTIDVSSIRSAQKRTRKAIPQDDLANPRLDVYPSTPLALTSDDFATADGLHPGAESLLSIPLTTANAMWVMHDRSPSS